MYLFADEEYVSVYISEVQTHTHTHTPCDSGVLPRSEVGYGTGVEYSSRLHRVVRFHLGIYGKRRQANFGQRLVAIAFSHAKRLPTRMSGLFVVGRKSTLAASNAAPGESRRVGRRDRQTDGRQTVRPILRFPLDAVSVTSSTTIQSTSLSTPAVYPPAWVRRSVASVSVSLFVCPRSKRKTV